MVVYSAATNVSVGRMFLGGVVPGLLAGLMLIIAIYITARINLPKQPFVGWKEALKAAKEASWGLLLVVIILSGIYGGSLPQQKRQLWRRCTPFYRQLHLS